jgi:hypothetical protein
MIDFIIDENVAVGSNSKQCGILYLNLWPALQAGASGRCGVSRGEGSKGGRESVLERL